MKNECWVIVHGGNIDIRTGDGNQTVPLGDGQSFSIDAPESWVGDLRRRKLSGCPVLISPLAQDCFFVDLGDGIVDDDSSAMTYELESHLPVDAEYLAADFQESEGSTLAVAIDARRVRPLIDGLEDAGLVVSAIVPKPLLILRAWLESHRDHESFTGRVWIAAAEDVNVVDLVNGRLRRWKWLPRDDDAIEVFQRLNPVSQPSVVVFDDVVAGDGGGAIDWGSRLADQSVQTGSASSGMNEPHASASAIVASALRHHVRGQHGRWWNLLGGPLANADPLWSIRRPLRTLALASTLLIAALAGAAWYRTQQIDQAMTKIQDQQRQAFRKTFPERRVPAATLRSVRSEYTRALGSRALGSRSLNSSDSGGMDLPVSSADILRRLFLSLPPEIRFRVLRIDIDNNDLQLDLQVIRPVDAGAIATALNEMGFQVNPPVTNQKDPQTYESTIVATYLRDRPENRNVGNRNVGNRNVGNRGNESPDVENPNANPPNADARDSDARSGAASS